MSARNEIIYFDNNSTTQTCSEARDAYNLISEIYYANPSSLSVGGLKAYDMLENSRKGIKKLLKAEACNLYFTSGATEANNIVIKTYLENALKDNLTVLTSKLEHSSVLNIFKHYESRGVNVIYLNKNQVYKLENLPDLSNIYFASLMTFNNESGIFTNINKFRELLGGKALIHSDLTQMVGKVETNINETQADFFTFSGHKFHSPKGVGGLISKKMHELKPLFIGGGQEDGVRPGTTNLASAYSMFVAMDVATKNLVEDGVSSLRDEFEKKILERISGVRIVGKDLTRLPNTSYFSLEGVNSDVLVSNSKQVAISNGSACNSYSHEISHVAREMSISKEEASSMIRVSFSRYNNSREVTEAVELIAREVSYIRGSTVL
jgi:cysteine desulfurase